MALIRKILPRTLSILISKRTRPCSLNTSLVTYHIITYTHNTQDQSVVNRETSCVMSIIPSFHCRICAKNVHDKDKAIQCDLCEFWIHIKCNNLNDLDYRYLQKCDESWYCIECCSSSFPFNSLSSNKNFLTCCTSTDSDSNFIQLKELENDHNSSLLVKPSPNLELLVNQFNNATPENNNDPETISSSKYYDIDEMHDLKIHHKNKSLSLFHINACCLNENFDALQHLLSSTKKVFDIIAVSETRITMQVSLLNNLNLYHYSFEFTPTETSAGGTLLYIANHLSYKCRNDLNIYKNNELESTFIEIVNPKKSNIIVGVIYRHPSMDLADFNSNCLNKLLENISKEQKSMFLLGDFNVNLLNYNKHNQTNEFLDSLASNSFIPLILQPTRITSHSITLIDNIFSNVIEPDIIPDNLTATISDHLPQFAINPNIFGNISGNKYNIYERDWSKFDRENFILDYFFVDWEDLLKIDKLKVDNSTKMYLDAINLLLDTYAPLKRINKYKLKFKSKSWITLGLQKSISVKNKLFVNFINKKDPILKEEFQTEGPDT